MRLVPRCATQPNLYYTQIRRADLGSARQPLMPGDHSKLEPLLPIPNRTVKQLRADDSAGSRVKVGHRQALTALKTPSRQLAGVLSLRDRKLIEFLNLRIQFLSTPSPRDSL